MLAPDRQRSENGSRPRFDFDETAATYLADLSALIGALDVGAVRRLTERLRAVRDRGGTVFIAGNGGSAATAAHWVNDLCKATRASGRRPFRCTSLSDNGSWLTALANDEGYERVFAAQLENLASEGDILVVISASGRSPNLLAAVGTAADRGLETAALLGFDGGLLRELVDEPVLVDTHAGEYGLVETMHCIVTDIVTTFLSQDYAESLDT